MTEKGQRTGCRMMRIIAVSILGLILFSGSAYAARENGEVIFGKDLTVGEKVTVQIATDKMKDAFVVKEGSAQDWCCWRIWERIVCIRPQAASGQTEPMNCQI